MAFSIADPDIPVHASKIDGKLYLYAKSCDPLLSDFYALRKWKKKLNEDTSKSRIECSCDTEDAICKVDISKVASDILSEYEGVTSDFDGPNCWNASLVASKILPYPRYSTAEEMYFWLNSPLCHEVSRKSEMEPGDVIAIRDENNEEYHAFIYISPDLAFSKNGNFHREPYGLTPTKMVYQFYDVFDECERTLTNQTVQGEYCLKSAQIFRCQSWEDFWREENLSNQQVQAADKISNIECIISKGVFDRNNPIDEKLLKDSLNIILELAKSNGGQIDPRESGHYKDLPPITNKKKSQKVDDLFWDSIAQRVDATLTQINIIYPYSIRD